jgi:hypothetical protein
MTVECYFSIPPLPGHGVFEVLAQLGILMAGEDHLGEAPYLNTFPQLT